VDGGDQSFYRPSKELLARIDVVEQEGAQVLAELKTMIGNDRELSELIST